MSETGPDGLLERVAELGRLREAIDAACAGSGALVLLEGPAGIGKTALLRRLRDEAQAAGMRVLTARGRELEQGFAFGVARQLFERPLAQLAPSERHALQAGAAGLALPLFDPAPAVEDAGSPRPSSDVAFALTHGLYWTTANLADRGPVLIALDDAQHADPATLRFLAYLGARCSDLPVLVAATVRTGEPTAADELLAALRDDLPATIVAPRALSAGAVTTLVRRRLGAAADERFCAACAQASAGNPFLLGELLAELKVGEVDPHATNVAHVEGVHPDSVSRAVLARLARLGHDAVELARAAAILERARLPQLATLARLAPEQARAAADRLVAAEILSGPDPLAFVHPLLRGAVYEQIPPAARAEAHGRAAQLLAVAGAPTTIAGAHLLRSTPAADAAAVELLRRAAADALERGEPGTGARLLRRALEEPPSGAVRPELIAELGEALALSRDPGAADQLAEALDLVQAPATRVRLACTLAQLLTWSGVPARGHAVLVRLLDELDELDELGERAPAAVRVPAETMRAATASVDRRLVAEVDERLPLLHELARSAGRDGRALRIFEASWLAQTGTHGGDWRTLLDDGLDGGRFVADYTAGAPMVGYVTIVLVLADEVERARSLLAEIRSDARARGSILAHILDVAWGALLALRGGDVRTAAADAQTALELAAAHEAVWAVTWMVACLADALRERGELGAAAAVLERAPIEAVVGTAAALHALMARARIRLAQGDRAGAIADLRTTGENVIVNNPSYIPWRSTLALAVAADDPDQARSLVEAELARSRRLGQPRGIGVALRARALIAGGSEAVEGLTEAVAVLRGSPARLELARTLAELGAAQRRAGQRVAAREPLREAVELAHACGAELVAVRARQELLAAGARPRRDQRSGPASLTPSERRVAELAAAGLANREIAQSLFVTTKTVGTHLAHIYQKLDLQGARARESLAERLAAPR